MRLSFKLKQTGTRICRFFDASRVFSALGFITASWLFVFYLLNPWQDVLVFSNQLLSPTDNFQQISPVVFVQINEDFLSPDLPMAAQFEDWGMLLQKLGQHSPRVVLMDYQIGSRRFERIVPGAAARFEKVMQSVANDTILVMGMSPDQQDERDQAGKVDGIHYPKAVHLACMHLAANHDGVIREFSFAFPAHCPDHASFSMAGAAALALGNTPKGAGLLLPVAKPPVSYFKAADLLDDKVPSEKLVNAIVVVGSNFPHEDEHQSSHFSNFAFFHQPVKGALIHALQLQSHLNGDVAWFTNSDWMLVGLLFFVIFCLFAAIQGKWVSPLIITSFALLLTDLFSTVFLRLHLELFYWAACSIAAVLVIQTKTVMQNLLLKRKIETLLGGLLSPAVMLKCLEDPEGFFKTRRIASATVLVLDIKGYSAESSTADVETLYNNTNLLMGFCTRTVHDHGGCVERFRGDGLLAYFGAPMETNDHLDKALASAMNILQAIDSNKPDGLRHYNQRIRIGISKGELIVGRVGDASRFDIGVTGQAANRAAHFESLADPSLFPIVIDEESLAESAQQWISRPLDIIHPKHPNRHLCGLVRQQAIQL